MEYSDYDRINFLSENTPDKTTTHNELQNFNVLLKDLKDPPYLSFFNSC